MIKTDFTFSWKRYVSGCASLATLIFFMCIASNVGAQGSMACNDLVQVSLDFDCQAEIYPDIVLEGTYPNPDNYEVSIQGLSGNIVTTPGLYKVTVTEISTGNNCWGEILVEDKLAPQIDDCLCPPGNTDQACEYMCTDEAAIENGALSLPEPVVFENCGGYTSSKTDHIADNGCDGKILTRTWIFEDGSGNVSQSCVQEFRLLPVDLGDVTMPVSPVILDCGAAYEPEDIYAFHNDVTYAWPTINGQPINNQVCNIMASKTDIATDVCNPACSNSKKIIRRWIILDWCQGEVREYGQIIKAQDLTPPTIEAEDKTVSIDPWGCEATVVLDPPSILHDACTDYVTYEVHGPLGVTVSYDASIDRWVAYDVPKGVSDFKYIGLDCCENKGLDTIQITVQDLSAPVAVAKQNIVVSLTSGGGIGLAKIYAPSVDNGSHDGCTDVHLEIRRDSDVCDIAGNATYNDDNHPNDSNNDPDEGQYVKFCCSDLTEVDANGIEYGLVKVWLRVWDDGDMDGHFGSAGDNYNETWAMVRVDDKLTPQISCPSDVTIECTDDIHNLELTGEATGNYTCGPADVEYEISRDLRDNCGFGDVYKRWFLTSDRSVYCEQKITVLEGDRFYGDDIIWPRDRTTDCLNLGALEEPTWSGAACSSVGYSIESDTFRFESDACFKILNTYTVIDWCHYDPNNYYYDAKWTHTQTIKVLDDVKPVLDSCRDIMVEINDHGDLDNDGITCEAREVVLTNSATDNGDCASDWLKWEIKIDIDADGYTDYEYTSFVSRFDNRFDDDNGNGIPDRYVAPTMSGEEVSVVMPEDLVGPMSNHKVHWTVTDGCGNRKSCVTNVMAVDKKAPTPYCLNISTALMDVTGTVEIWAVDFNKNSFDNCTRAEDLLYTFNNESPVASKINEVHYFKGAGEPATLAEYNNSAAQRWNPESKSSGMVFTCDDMPQVFVDMTVWDEKGNSDFCTVHLTLSDNFGACTGGKHTIQGTVATEDGGPMSGVVVELTPDIADANVRLETDEEGKYAFSNALPGLAYAVSAEYEDAHDTGVSTLDLVLIQRHILGLSKLDSPYKIIAADVNNDDKIRGSDVVALRKLILGVTTEFENSTSWRFVDKAVEFADAEDPFPVPYTMNTGDMVDNMQKDIIAMKIGDVNNSNGFNSADATENRSAQFTLFVEDEFTTAGETYTIAVKAAAKAEMAGCQLALDLNGLDYLSVLSGELQITASDVAFRDGQLLISYAPQASSQVNVGDVLFTLHVASTSADQLSEQISLGDALTPEAYLGKSLQVRSFDLGFERSLTKETEAFQLLQNQPNPFKGETTISFVLPEAGQATLSIYDITGKNLYAQTGDFAQGTNSITIQQSLINATGVLYYRLESGDNVATKKMIQIQ